MHLQWTLARENVRLRGTDRGTADERHLALLDRAKLLRGEEVDSDDALTEVAMGEQVDSKLKQERAERTNSLDLTNSWNCTTIPLRVLGPRYEERAAAWATRGPSVCTVYLQFRERISSRSAKTWSESIPR